VKRAEGRGTVCQEDLPFLDIPGGDKPSSKLRVTIYSDWEAWSIPFPVLLPVLITRGNEATY